MSKDLQDKLAKVNISAKKPPSKLPPGKIGKPCPVTTNVYPIQLQKNIPYFMYDFRAVAVYKREGGEDKYKEITKQTKDDFTEQQRNEATILIYKALRAKGTLKTDCIYDRAAILYSMEKIQGAETGIKIDLDSKNAKLLFALPYVNEAHHVEVSIKKAEEAQVTSNDLASGNEKTRELLHVVDLATSQNLFFNPAEFIVYGSGEFYYMDNEQHGIRENPDLSGEKYLGYGGTKGALEMEGNKIGLAVDPKVSVFFYDDMPLNEVIEKIGIQNTRELSRLLKGVRCRIVYSGQPAAQRRNNRSIIIGSITNITAGNFTFTTRDGRMIQFTQYVRETYKTEIKLKNSFMVAERTTGCNFAQETLHIAPNQRAKTEQLQKKVQEMQIRKSAIKPFDRRAQTATCFRALNITSEAQKAKSIWAEEKPIAMNARVLGPINLTMGGGKSLAAAGPWRPGNFISPGVLTNWSIIHLANGRLDIGQVARKLVTDGKQYGIKIDNPNIVEERPDNNQYQQLFRLIKAERDNGSNFVLLVCDDRIQNHEILKDAERQLQIITEQFTSFNAGKFGGSTYWGVLCKMNEKAGGQNVALGKGPGIPSWFFGPTMIVGMIVHNPRPMSSDELNAKRDPHRPAIISYSYNAVKGASKNNREYENSHFSCHYTFANPREVSYRTPFLSTLQDEVKNALTTWRNYRGGIPKNIVIYLGSVADGDEEKVVDEMVSVWNQAYKEAFNLDNPTLIIITASGSHNIRAYKKDINPGDRPAQQNCPSGLVIDNTITHPKKDQCYMQSHVPLQGTARMQLYTLQYKQPQSFALSNDEWQWLTHALTHLHGMCSSPTSTPTPLYIADDTLKRANEQFNYWSANNDSGKWTVEELNSELAYGPDHPLTGYRYTA